MANLTFTPPADGAAVTMQNGRLCVPDRPVIPFIIGDGTGPEIWAAASRVIDAAVAKAYDYHCRKPYYIQNSPNCQKGGNNDEKQSETQRKRLD